MGSADQRRGFQGNQSRHCGLSEISAAGDGTHVARVNCDLMATRSSRGLGRPAVLIAPFMRVKMIGTQSAEFIMARGHAHRNLWRPDT